MLIQVVLGILSISSMSVAELFHLTLEFCHFSLKVEVKNKEIILTYKQKKKFINLGRINYI